MLWIYVFINAMTKIENMTGTRSDFVQKTLNSRLYDGFTAEQYIRIYISLQGYFASNLLFYLSDIAFPIETDNISSWVWNDIKKMMAAIDVVNTRNGSL